MDFTLSKEHEMARQLFKDFAENEVKPLAQEVDEEERFPRETVEKMAKYGFLGIPVPKEYDNILKTHYGSYMELPPVGKRGQHHEILFDPDKPYTEYIGKFSKEEAQNLLNNY